MSRSHAGISLKPEYYAEALAQPDADLEWLERLSAEDVAKITETEETSVLETRPFRFHCGCTVERIVPILGGWRDKPDELFHGEEAINVQCPRCAASYRITRDMI
jgi:molecular chaperone Hsp33